PKRFMGVWARILATRSGCRILRFCSAGKKPGERALTRIPWGAHSRARFMVRLSTAAFVALYVKTRERGRIADIDVMLMITPPCFWSISVLPNTWQPNTTDL